MPETNLPDVLLKIGLALAKHHIKNVIGDEALEVVASTLTDVGGEKVQAKVDSIFASKEGQKELLKAANAADQSFKKKCKDKDLRGLFTMDYGDLPSVQAAIAGLPEALDDETLRETLFTAFRGDSPKSINDEKITEGVSLYVECLQSAFISVNDFGLRIIHNALKEIGKDVKEIKSDVKFLLEKTTVNLQPSNLLKPFALEIPSWFQNPSFRNADSSPSESKKIQLEALVTELVKENIKRFALVGKSGCGKSVTMKAIMRSLSSRDDNAVPCIYVPLGNYAQNLASTVKSNIGWQDVPDDKVFIELGNLGATILLDALNEVPGMQRDQCRNEIKALMTSHQGGVVVSFPLVDRTHFNFECSVYEIIPMEEEQIKHIVVAYFEHKEKKAEWFLDKFAPNGRFSSEFLQWVELPLNLQFMLELGSDTQFGSRSIRDLYGQVVDLRFNQLLRQEKKGKFPIDVMKECLADLAIQSLVDDYGVRMPKSFVKKTFSRKLSTVETSEIINEIIRSGLLNEIGENVQWFHASLRDYMAGYSLYALAGANSTLDRFSIEQPHWNGAVAYAIGLSTTPTESQTLDDLRERSNIFNEFLNRKPAFELVRSVIQEYHHSFIVGDSPDRKGTESDFQTLNWGDRFVSAYNQYVSILQNENRSLSKNLPKLRGLKVFVSASGRFCAMAFSEDDGIQFDDLVRFDDQVVEAIKSVKSCIGFCLHGYLLPTIDPEVVAYSQVVTWLNFLVRKDTERYQDWLQDIPSFSVLTPNEWVDWQTQEYSDPKVKLGRQPQKTTFLWRDFFAPLTFCIDPFVIPSVGTSYSTRSGSLVFTRKPASHISLMLLLPGSPKSLMVDIGTLVHIPMPAINLNRDYSVDGMSMSYTKGGPFISFMHLRG